MPHTEFDNVRPNRTFQVVAQATAGRQPFNGNTVAARFFAESIVYIKLGDGTVDIADYGEADVIPLPAGEWFFLPIVDPIQGRARASNFAFMAPDDTRLRVAEYDRTTRDGGATGVPYST